MIFFFLSGLLATIPTSQNSTTILNPNVGIKKEKATSPKQYIVKKCKDIENGIFSIPQTPVKKENDVK